jgi:NitT/TauT family transport system ATP-binding protein
MAKASATKSKAKSKAAMAGNGTSPSGSVISVKDCRKVYATKGGKVEAVRTASFDVKQGEFVSLVGPSGCGKSTLLQICAGLLPWNAGTVEVGGIQAKSGRQDVGIMFQSAVLLPWRSVIENVMLPTEIFGLDGKESQKKAEDLLDLVGLKGFEDKHPWELSGGMQQRASLARALVFDPDIMLMDEPFASLDEFTRERLNIELARLHESLGRTILYVTHNIQEAVFLSDKVVVMKPHPGEVLDIIDVNLPRPRSTQVLDEAGTVELVIKIRRMLYVDGMIPEEERHGLADE